MKILIKFTLLFILVAIVSYSNKSFANLSINADNVAVILGDTINDNRYRAIEVLKPHIKGGLTGTGMGKILGTKSKEIWRSKMIIVLAEKTGPELSGDDVAIILGNTTNGFRTEAIKALRPQIKRGLVAAEIVKILGTKSKAIWRSSMIRVLFSRDTESELGAATNGNSTSPQTKPQASLLAIARMGQKKGTDYRGGDASANTPDGLYHVQDYSCLATVYAMIETAYGDSDAKIDDFYDDPRDGNSIGAFIPPNSLYSPLSGKTLSASFIPESRDTKYSKEAMIKALDNGQLVILHDSEGGELEQHFILVKGYENKEGRPTVLIVNDPLSASEKHISADDPKLGNYIFNAMRLVKKNGT